jgi:predicted Fe-Mo cluster-binding NifX family protein
MKIAVVTDDGQTVSLHFGRATHYLVFSVEGGQITAKDMIEKPGHRQFAQGPHEHQGGRGGSHGRGPDAERRHARMIEPVTDCEAVLGRGMGRGAYAAIQEAHIKPVVTDIENAEAAVKAYIDGSIVDHPENLH